MGDDITLAPVHVHLEMTGLGIPVLPLVHLPLPQRCLGLGDDVQHSGQIGLRSRTAQQGGGEDRTGAVPLQLGQQLLVLLRGQVQSGEHVWPPLPGASELLLAPPALHLTVVASEQLFGDGHIVPHLRPGVLGILQQAVPMAFIFIAGGIGQNPRHQAAHCVGHRHGGNLPPGEHKVPQGDLLIHIAVDESLVNALIVAAHQNQVLMVTGQPFGVCLGEGLAAGGQVDGASRAVGVSDMLPALIERVGLHHSTAAAAVGRIVRLMVLVERIIADIRRLDLDKALVLCAPDDAFAHDRVDHLGKQRHNVDFHSIRPSILST